MRSAKSYSLFTYLVMLRNTKAILAVLLGCSIISFVVINYRKTPTCEPIRQLTSSTNPTSTTNPHNHVTPVKSTVASAIPPPAKPDGSFFTGPKLGIIVYIPYRPNFYYVIQFVTFIYASWHFMLQHHNLVTTNNTTPLLNIDLLVYCHPATCSYLPNDCYFLPQYIHKPGHSHKDPVCLWHPSTSFQHGDKVVDSFAFVKDNHFYNDVISHYTYLMRSDVDTFLTPALLTWYPPSPVVVGNGGYCDPFNMRQLKRIANESGLRHQGIHCLGSTWYGESKRILEIANLTVRMVKHVRDNEFDAKKNPEIAKYMNKSSEGEWPYWWRPVSVLYGSELALNHLIDNITDEHRMRTKMDVPSCTKTSIFQHPHIHTWHDDCEFQKFRFLDPIVSSIFGDKGTIPIYLSYISYRNPKDMSVSEYCTYVARNSLYQYLPWLHNLVENKERPVISSHES